MSTKNNPGPFNCYAKAEPDEPMFILLARDPQAPELVRLWAEKLLAGSPAGGGGTFALGADLEKVKEAFNVARTMDWWRATRERNSV